MSERRMGHPKVIGVGNRWRGDDAAGLATAGRVREEAGEDVEVAELEGELSSLIDSWRDSDHVIVIDAVSSGALPGTVHRIDARSARLPPGLAPHSTHAVGLAAAIELGRALNRLPPRLVVFGIEGERFEAGAELTPRVRHGITRTVAAVMDELRVGG